MSSVAPAPPLEQQNPQQSKHQYLTAVLQSPPVVTLTAYIPTSAVGAVIGRRGQNVEELQRRAAQSATTRQPVRVSVVGHDLKHNAAAPSVSSPLTSPVVASSQSSAASLGGESPMTGPTASSASLPQTYSGLDFSDPDWTPVVVRADVEAAMAAGRGLMDVCNGQCDEVVLDVPLPRHRHATVVGKHGLTIAKLSADHDVRIMIPHKESRHDMIQLEGDFVKVQQCLLDLLNVAGRMPRSDSAGTAAVSDSLTVPHPAPSQTRIRNVARKTDCSIKKKKLPGTDGWQLFVTGKTNEQVAAAMAMLAKWKEEQPFQPEQNPDGDGNTNTTAAAATATTTAAAPTYGVNKTRRRNKIRGRKKNNSNSAPRTPSANEGAS